ncbi:hypothetical protein LJR251_006009 [Rhizobium rhizogenes]
MTTDCHDYHTAFTRMPLDATRVENKCRIFDLDAQPNARSL